MHVASIPILITLILLTHMFDNVNCFANEICLKILVR